MAWYKSSLCMICVGVGAWCFASSFLVKEKPVAKKALSQVRNDVTQHMSELIEQLSSTIERKAHLQQKLCKELRRSLEGAKESIIAAASPKELQRLSDEILIAQKRLGQDRTEHDRLLRLLS